MYSNQVYFEANPEPIQHCRHQQDYFVNKEVVRMLVVSGGGVGGVIPLSFLKYLEDRTNKPTSELFDFFSGTSTGSIIVSALNLPNEFGKARFNASNILNTYMELSQYVMQASFWRKVFTLNGFLGPRYSVETLHKQLENNIGKGVLFKDLLNHVAITTFNLSESNMEIIKNWDCHELFQNFSVADLLTGATAAPMAFSPAIFIKPKTLERIQYVDAAMIANNPILYVNKDILQIYPNAKKIILVYLDTGSFHIRQLNLTSESHLRWGALQWAVPLLKILFKSQKKLIHQGILNILDFQKSEDLRLKYDYHYFNIDYNIDVFNGDPLYLHLLLDKANEA
ncbi:MAG: hypothetical protein EBY16_03810, partial [Gammaproteobacteria bacterium]|nr:hypothetical protein [Gammaproteobacteria bacterium]